MKPENILFADGQAVLADFGVARACGARDADRDPGLTLAIEGRPEEAERVLREAVTMHGSGTYTMATLGFALPRAGKTAEAEALLAQLEALRRREYVSPVALATLNLGLGHLEPALDWTERAYEERRGWLAYLDVNPLLDPLRGHPRFEALAARMRG